MEHAMFITESDDYAADEDYLYNDADDTPSDTYKSVSEYQSYLDGKDYNEHEYGYKPKKKKVYVPVFVPEKEKKKSKMLCTPCSIKKESLIFDYNCRISWSIFIILAPVKRGINTPQYRVINLLNCLMTS